MNKYDMTHITILSHTCSFSLLSLFSGQNEHPCYLTAPLCRLPTTLCKNLTHTYSLFFYLSLGMFFFFFTLCGYIKMPLKPLFPQLDHQQLQLLIFNCSGCMLQKSKVNQFCNQRFWQQQLKLWGDNVLINEINCLAFLGCIYITVT